MIQSSSDFFVCSFWDFWLVKARASIIQSSFTQTERDIRLLWPVGNNLHVSGHLLTEQLLVVFTLLLHLCFQLSLLVPHFIYGTLDNTHTHTHGDADTHGARWMRLNDIISPNHWSITAYDYINQSTLIPLAQQSRPRMQPSSSQSRPPAPHYASRALQAPSLARKSTETHTHSRGNSLKVYPPLSETDLLRRFYFIILLIVM